MDKTQDLIEEYLTTTATPMRVQIAEGGQGSGNFGHGTGFSGK